MRILDYSSTTPKYSVMLIIRQNFFQALLPDRTTAGERKVLPPSDPKAGWGGGAETSVYSPPHLMIAASPSEILHAMVK